LEDRDEDSENSDEESEEYEEEYYNDHFDDDRDIHDPANWEEENTSINVEGWYDLDGQISGGPRRIWRD